MEQRLNKTTTNAQEINPEAISEGASQAGMGIILTVAAAVGVWSVACMIGGLVNAGGIGQLARAWFTAVTGI
jgi:hypothetical protein